MKISNELLAKASAAGSVEELLEIAKAENVELTAHEAEKVFANMHKSGELSDDELENAAGAGCSDSGNTPKFSVNQKVWKYANRGSYPVTVVYVSTDKKDCGGIITSNVFTYSVKPDDPSHDIETDVPEYDLHT